MRVLVIGGAGFIGSHTVDSLLAAGHRVRVLDALRQPVHLPGVVPGYLPPDVECRHGDGRDEGALLQALRGVDAVVHLAASQDELPDFSTFASLNEVGTALLYEVIVRERLPIAKVVVASSQATYGEGHHRCPAHGAVYPDLRSVAQLEARLWECLCPQCGALTAPQWTDEAQVKPHNAYAISK